MPPDSQAEQTNQGYRTRKYRKTGVQITLCLNKEMFCTPIFPRFLVLCLVFGVQDRDVSEKQGYRTFLALNSTTPPRLPDCTPLKPPLGGFRPDFQLQSRCKHAFRHPATSPRHPGLVSLWKPFLIGTSVLLCNFNRAVSALSVIRRTLPVC